MEDVKCWMQERWRPISAFVYLAICIVDFVVFPIIWALFLHWAGSPKEADAWSPLTLQGGGLFHISFGAILGVSALTRGQEKIAKITSATRAKKEDDS